MKEEKKEFHIYKSITASLDSDGEVVLFEDGDEKMWLQPDEVKHVCDFLSRVTLGEMKFIDHSPELE